MEPVIPTSVLSLFRSAGWSPSRVVPTKAPREHPAHPVLRAFAGLRVGRVGPGETCASSDIDFKPLVQEPEDHLIDEWGHLLRTNLIGVGEVHNGHGDLWAASDGRFFGRSLIHDAFYFEGGSFGEAAERLLLGRRARPLIHPSQDSVMMYGETYTRDHPDIYDFETTIS